MRSRVRVRIVAVIVVACSAISAWLVHTSAAQKPKREAVREFMRAKLEASQSTLEGLVMEDFDEIARQAVRLQAMSRRAEWNVIEGKIYQQLSTEFRDSAGRMATAARERNLDKASLAYVQMTINCLNCHKVVRGAKLVEAPGFDQLRNLFAGLESSR